MDDALVFYTNPMSRGRIVRWMLEEAGAPYRTEVLDYATMKLPDYLAVNPMGKVPALSHRGTVVTEVAAVCAYLADAIPEAGLAPAPGSAARGEYYRWLFFASGPLEAAITNAALGFVVPPERERMAGYGTLTAVMDTLEAVLERRDTLAGDRFSAADLYVASHLGFGFAFGSIEKRPAFVRFHDRHAARPVAIRARELDDALIPPRS